MSQPIQWESLRPTLERLYLREGYSQADLPCA